MIPRNLDMGYVSFSMRTNPCIIAILLIVLVFCFNSYIHAQIAPGSEGQTESAPTFNIKAFTVEGNTLLTKEKIEDIINPYRGKKKTAEDVEKARDSLEKFYHELGYPAVLVNLPEQTVEGGNILLQVIESTIGNVRVTGNRYFTREKILRDLPSLSPGKILFLPDAQNDLARVNRSQDLKVIPLLAPGKELGKTDVELKVEDKLPLHGSLELNNRSAHDTSDLRINASLRYDNLWQMDHSVSFQFQISPEKTDEVKMYAFSYTLPAPWITDHQIAFYGVKSDSNTTTTAQDLLITGKGDIFGVRYVLPLTPYGRYFHNLTIGLDHKDFEETTGFGTGQNSKTPITYLPLSFSYSSSLPDSWGMTRFSSGLNVVFRGLMTDQQEFANKRYKARGNYMYFTTGVERYQKLPANMNLFLKLDGQISDQPLISNEQYAAGGTSSVRGYKEAEAFGDDAFHTTCEISGPDVVPLIGFKKKVQLTPFISYDFAWLKIKNPLPGQERITRLHGTGIGVRGEVWNHFFYEAVLGIPLRSTDKTKAGHERFHFKVGMQF